MRVADWLAALESGEEACWRRLSAEVLEACRRHGAADAEDLAAAFVARQVARRGADLRRARSGTLLAAYANGVARNLVRQEWRDRQRRRLGSSWHNADAVAAPETGDADPLPDHRADLDNRMRSRLGASARAALDLHREGVPEREAARRLGISRDAYRERRDRAIDRVRRPIRAWALRAAEGLAAAGDELSATVLRLHAERRRHAAVADATGLTYSAVRDRIARVRAKLGLRGRD